MAFNKTPWLCHLVSSVQCPVSSLDPLSTTSTAISLGIMKPPTSPVDPPDSSVADLWGRNDKSELEGTVQTVWGAFSFQPSPSIPSLPYCHFTTVSSDSGGSFYMLNINHSLYRGIHSTASLLVTRGKDSRKTFKNPLDPICAVKERFKPKI